MIIRWWEYLLLFLGTFIIFVYILCQTTSPSLEKYLNKQSISIIDHQKVLDTANNGDLIFLSGNTRGEKTCKWFTGSVFSHVGLLFREDNILYITDCDIGQGHRSGVRVMKLEDKLARYKGVKIGAIRRYTQNSRPTREDILEIVGKYIGLQFDEKILTWFLAGTPLYRLAKNKHHVFCSEYIIMILQDLNIVKQKHVPAWYSPGHMAKNEMLGFGELEYFKF